MGSFSQVVEFSAGILIGLSLLLLMVYLLLTIVAIILALLPSRKRRISRELDRFLKELLDPAPIDRSRAGFGFGLVTKSRRRHHLS